MSSSPQILVAGVGNVFLGDDAFGVEVARRLAGRAQREGVCVADFGVRGYDLACALSTCSAAILIDAVRRGGAPGTLYLLSPRIGPAAVFPDAHAMTPDRVLASLPRESWPRRLRIVGCEVASLDPEEGGELSDPVRSAVDGAVHMVEALVEEWLSGGHVDA